MSFMNMKKPEKGRRSLLTERSLELRFLSMVFIYSLLIFAFLAGSLFLSDVYQMQDESLSIEIRASIADRVISVHALVWPTLIALILLICFHFFRNFQRLVGPLGRFRRIFEQAANGDLRGRVKLEEKEYLKKEEEVLNEMLQSLSAKLKEIKRAGAEAEVSLSELEEALKRDEQCWSESANILEEHSRNLKVLMKSLSYFRTKESEENSQGIK